VIDLVHKLGLRAVVSGVDSAEALELARELGCDFGQGDAAEQLLRVAA
jgi:EAL domain-containing protein (putative c-di-GMP-specific phosphodiesterase class I)